MNNPKVSIIILNWNRLNDITECIDSVIKSTYINYEIIVIDNASADGSPEKLKQKYPQILLLRNEKNYGFAGGNNIGIREAINRGADYVWLLNNDTVVEADTLSKLVIDVDCLPLIGLASPVIYFYSDPALVQSCGAYFDYGKKCINNYANIEAYKKDGNHNVFLWGTALLIKKDVISKVGYLNESFFAYHEDADYSLRAISAGCGSRVVTTSKIYHKYHNSNENIIGSFPPHYYYYMVRNEYWLWRNNLGVFNRLKFVRKYLCRSIETINILKHRQYSDSAEAACDGVFCAFCGIGGEWNKNVKMPAWLKNLVMTNGLLLEDILNLKFSKLFKLTCLYVQKKLRRSNV